MKKFLLILIVLPLHANIQPSLIQASRLDKLRRTSTLSKQESTRIGQKIFLNECGGKKNNLTWWGKNEEFTSLGIGHFIWYPKGRPQRYTQTFPELLQFLQVNGSTLPTWLKKAPYCPWQSYASFCAEKNSKKMIELRNLLANTIDLQAKFIIQQLEKALPRMLKSIPHKKRSHIKNQFYRVAQQKNGLYALIDYINFKGDGTNPKECYNNKGWGLLHILQNMQGKKAATALQEFASTAEQLLTQRIHNSPPHRNEKKYLLGWKRRVATYTEQDVFQHEILKLKKQWGNQQLSCAK